MILFATLSEAKKNDMSIFLLSPCIKYAYLSIIELEEYRNNNETIYLDWIKPRRPQAVSR